MPDTPQDPFLGRLDEEARGLLLSVARQVSFMKGARLVRHGEPARGAWLLREGLAEAVVTLHYPPSTPSSYRHWGFQPSIRPTLRVDLPSLRVRCPRS